MAQIDVFITGVPLLFTDRWVVEDDRTFGQLKASVAEASVDDPSTYRFVVTGGPPLRDDELVFDRISNGATLVIAQGGDL
jgi:hypothetical protein